MWKAQLATGTKKHKHFLGKNLKSNITKVSKNDFDLNLLKQ